MLPKVRQFLTELSRIELVDRSLVLGAQALLAVVPLLIVLGDALPEAVTTDIVAQLRALLGVDARDLEDVRKAMTAEAAPVNTSLLSLLVAAFSASSFGRALQRLYTRVWGVRLSNPAASYGSALLWIVGWVVAFQMLLLLLRTLSGLPLSGLLSVALQLTVSAGLWWWTAWFLLGRQVRWRRLLPTAVASAVGIVVFQRVAALFTTAFFSANVQQYGALGLVFSLGTWLVAFGGCLVTATVFGHLVEEWWSRWREHARAGTPDEQTRRAA